MHVSLSGGELRCGPRQRAGPQGSRGVDVEVQVAAAEVLVRVAEALRRREGRGRGVVQPEVHGQEGVWAGGEAAGGAVGTRRRGGGQVEQWTEDREGRRGRGGAEGGRRRRAEGRGGGTRGLRSRAQQPHLRERRVTDHGYRFQLTGEDRVQQWIMEGLGAYRWALEAFNHGGGHGACQHHGGGAEQALTQVVLVAPVQAQRSTEAVQQTGPFGRLPRERRLGRLAAAGRGAWRGWRLPKKKKRRARERLAGMVEGAGKRAVVDVRRGGRSPA